MNEAAKNQETITDEALAQDATLIKTEFERTQQFDPEPIVQFYINAGKKLTQKDGVIFYGGNVNPAAIPRHLTDGAQLAVETMPGEGSTCEMMIGDSADDRSVSLTVYPDSVSIFTRTTSHDAKRGVVLTIGRGDSTFGYVVRSSEGGNEESSYLTNERALREPITANLMNAEEALSSLEWVAQKIATMPDGKPTIEGSDRQERKLVFDPAVETEFAK